MDMLTITFVAIALALGHISGAIVRFSIVSSRRTRGTMKGNFSRRDDPQSPSGSVPVIVR